MTHQISLSVGASTDQSRNKVSTSEDRVNSTATTTVESDSEVCTLEIGVKNDSDREDVCSLEWYFISEKTPVKGDKEPGVFDSGKEELTLQKGSDEKKTIVSKPFVFTVRTIDRVGNDDNNDSGNSKRTRQGDTYVGYIVLVKAGGKILDQDSNSSSYLTDEWLARCAAFVKPAEGKKKKK
ncbi:MAG: hypothetical protein WCH86_08730 [Kiritimatiellales bacterium]